MLLSYFNVSPAAELRLRKKKAEVDRVTKRELKIHAEDRIRRYEESLSVENIVSDVLSDCLEAVCEMLDDKARRQNPQEESKDEEKEEFVVPTTARTKRKRGWRTWLERSYAIYMYLHPGIFNYNAERATMELGIPRSTLLGWVSCGVKQNCVGR